MQCYHRIAAVDGLEGLGVVAGLAIGFPVPFVARIGTFNGEFGGSGLPHVDRRISHAATASGVITDDLIGACQIDCADGAR